MLKLLKSYFFLCFWLLFWCRSRSGSCGRLIRRIPTKWRVKLWGCVRAMSKKPKNKFYSLRFSSFFTSNCQNWAFSTGKSNSWRPTVSFPSWNGLESWSWVKTSEKTCFYRFFVVCCDFVFLNFWPLGVRTAHFLRLTVGIHHFRMENRIPHEKLRL